MGNASAIYIREAKEAEREVIQQVMVDAYKEYAEKLSPSRWVKYKDEIEASVDGTGPIARLIAEVNGEIVGSVQLFPSSEVAYGRKDIGIHSPLIRLLSVVPHARGQGIATALIEESARRSRARGSSYLYLHTSGMMESAVKLYQRLGFLRAFDKEFHNGENLVQSYRLSLEDSQILQAKEEVNQSKEVYRLATLDDAHSLLKVTVGAYESIRAMKIPFPAGYATIADVQDNIINHDCYALEVDGSIIATVTVDRSEQVIVRPLTELPFIRWFAVDPQFKGKGYGTKLLNWVEQNIIVNKLEAPAVTLATAERHPWLVSMYQRKGYKVFHQVVKNQEKIVFLQKDLGQERYANREG